MPTVMRAVNGLTLVEWLDAASPAGEYAHAQNLKEAWERGEDPADWKEWGRMMLAQKED